MNLIGWYRYEFLYQVDKWRNKLLMKIVWALPRNIIYWAFIRVVANATQNQRFAKTEVSAIPAMDMLGIWDCN